MSALRYAVRSSTLFSRLSCAFCMATSRCSIRSSMPLNWSNKNSNFVPACFHSANGIIFMRGNRRCGRCQLLNGPRNHALQSIRQQESNRQGPQQYNQVNHHEPEEPVIQVYQVCRDVDGADGV